MHFTNLAARRVFRLASLALLTILPFVAVPFAGDPYQPVRTLLSACALAVLAWTASASGAGPTVSRITRAAAIALVVVLAASLVSALVASPASALFGVHGRFQGLLTTVLFALAGFVGTRAGIGGREVRFLGRVAAGSLALQSGLVLVQRISGGDPAGTMGNAVLAAGWLVVLSALVAGVAIAERGWWRGLGLSAAALGLAALGATATRGAWVAALVAGIVAVVLARSARRVVPFAAAFLLVGALLLGGPAVVSKLASADLNTGSAGSRLEIWKATAAMIADHPVLGVGPGRYIYEYPAYQTAAHVRIEGGDTRADQAHGIVLQTAAETGVPGALALLALAGIALVAGVRGARRGDAVSLAGTIALSAFAAQALFGISTVETDTLAWFLGGLLISRGEHGDGRRVWTVRMAGVLACACALVAAVYIFADVAYRRSADAFERAQFGVAMEAAQSATDRDPLVDVYRVVLADAAAYAAVSGDGSAIDRALESVDAGLVLEPASYDLAASRARLLARSPSVSAPEVWQAYERAFGLYPRGVGIRTEALGWAQAYAPEDILAKAGAELQRVTSDTNDLDAHE